MEKKELKDKKNEIKEYKIEDAIILEIDHGYGNIKTASRWNFCCFTMTDDSNTFEFEVDPANFTEVLPDPFAWTAVEDTSFFKPESDSCEDRGVEFKINTIEMIDGKDWMNRNDCKVVRILLDATNNSDKEIMITNPFTPFQDGVELKLGHPMEEDENVDIQINAKIAPGETKQIAQTYVLYNESSPVIAMLNKSGNVYGTVYNLK